MNPSRPVYQFNRAIVRTPARSVTGGLRAHDRGDPSYEGILAEHAAYIGALRAAGVEVTILPPLEDFPDSIFVEDPALVFTEGAILLRPGAPTRMNEVGEIAPTLRKMFERVIDLPQGGFADGGDVLTAPGAVLIGLSARTDAKGAEALRQCLDKIGRKGELVETPQGVLHFKTDCSLVDDETILTTERLAASGVFRGRFRELLVPAGEEAAANALRVNGSVFVGQEYPRTVEVLTKAGYSVVATKVGEIGKIDAGLSCMSLRWFAQ